jgi:hypothetical protein
MERIPEVILNAGNRLFWDVDVAQLDPAKHEDFILGRVLSYGTLEMVQALRKVVTDSELRAFVLRAPHRLDLRSRRFFEVVLAGSAEEKPEPCATMPFRCSSDALFVR